ncbi:nitrate reductase molybdenum cofactor assembly chaperone [Dongshaea marina]|uniref:nitrate reductase molybdenum cofactor assembly chaperone n=1 Tax=Dongshaea marina TaxID=2047966 RepID=UPI000D3E4A6F|nr:nitrate reductase molybdenum cofactor assembly chaperone [Dongshaea marina]
MKTYRILSALLLYPQAELVQAIDELQGILEQESLLKRGSYRQLCELFDHLRSQELMELQIQYVDLFDRTPSLSLHLFEHVFGDDRARGQALADLQNLYQQSGLAATSNELPDYLPLFLEYLSVIQVSDAQESLRELVDLLETLRQRLEKRQSPYAGIFAALVELSKLKPNARRVKAAMKISEGELPSSQELDENWQEEEPFSGQPNQGCPHAGNCQQENRP